MVLLLFYSRITEWHADEARWKPCKIRIADREASQQEGSQTRIELQEEAGGSHDTQLHAHMQQPCLGLGPHERLHVPCCGSGGNGELTGDAGGFMIGHVGSAYLQGGVCMHTVQQELDLGRQPEASCSNSNLALNMSHMMPDFIVSRP